jgi:hypothetical protein
MSTSPIILPDPWTPASPLDQLHKQGANTVVGGVMIAVNNDALYAPVVFPCDCTVYALRMAGTNTSGNYDIGFYNAALERLVSKGSTAMAAAILSLTIPDIRVIGGETYYVGFAFSSTAAQGVRVAVGVTGHQRSVGFGVQASAFPLPNPAVPASTTGQGVAIPAFAFGIR